MKLAFSIIMFVLGLVFAATTFGINYAAHYCRWESTSMIFLLYFVYGCCSLGLSLACLTLSVVAAYQYFNVSKKVDL